MIAITVTTQAELDAALREHGDDASTTIIIDSPRGVWVTISDTEKATVRALGSATVRALGSATVEAWGSATVEAWGSATVRAWGSATVMALGSATVRAWDSATVRAWDSATVEASGSATVRAWDSATVEAWDSATVRAWDSATVRAWDSATVEASGSATVRASRYVAVHLFSERVTISGGVVIDVTDVHASTDPALWCDYHGIEIDSGGLAHLYKAVDDDLCAGHAYVKTAYRLGSDPTCDEWADNNECGRGLHACPRPRQALAHFPRATRFLEVTAPVETLRPIGATKAKAPTFHVLREVDLDGRPL